MYHTRDPEASPIFILVRDYFVRFEQVYPDQFQKQYGYWRPVIRDSIDKFLKCGDLKKGFARVRFPEWGTEFFVAFSCRQRCCCPSCDQKQSLRAKKPFLNSAITLLERSSLKEKNMEKVVDAMC